MNYTPKKVQSQQPFMKIIQNFIAGCGAIAIPVLTIDLAHAKDFKIGIVKESIPTSSVCVAFLPNTQKHMLVIPFPEKTQPVFAWMNIDGKDVRLRQVSLKVSKKQRRSIAKYRSNNISVTVDSKEVK